VSWENRGSKEPHAWLATATGQRTELRPNRAYVFGRDAGCDIVLDDSGCSRRHARLSVAGDVRHISLEDLKSKNGTFVNGRPIRQRIDLASGDRIQLGSAEYVVWIIDGVVEVHLDTRTTLLDRDK